MQRGWRAVCDRCGFEYKSYQLKQEWTGNMVCRFCWESRHPQDFVRAVKDEQAVPWTRPEPTPTHALVCYIDTASGYAGLGAAGCMQAGNNTQSYQFLLDFLGRDYILAAVPTGSIYWDSSVAWDSGILWS
jgi:hypothetical protein